MMSYKNQSYRILFPIFAAAVLFATLFLQAAHAENSSAQAPEYAVKYDNWKAAQFASQYDLQEVAEGQPLTYSSGMAWFNANQFAQVERAEVVEAKVNYSDALAQAYVSRFEPSLVDQASIDYSNDLALFYANAKQFAQIEADEAKVDYSDALALQYASRFEPALLDQVNIDYSNALALSYASQYGNFTTESIAAHNRTIRLDVAEAGTRFVFDDAPVFEDGMPAYGNSFVTEGYLYPAGTLSESNGVLPNGDPEFPELVIGRWTCRGWFIGDGAYTESGPWVITTQVYDFAEEVGAKSIITEGFELSDIGVAGKRAITGGTGIYSQARGNMTQTLIGFNETMGVNLQVSINPSR